MLCVCVQKRTDNTTCLLVETNSRSVSINSNPISRARLRIELYATSL